MDGKPDKPGIYWCRYVGPKAKSDVQWDLVEFVMDRNGVYCDKVLSGKSRPIDINKFEQYEFSERLEPPT